MTGFFILPKNHACYIASVTIILLVGMLSGCATIETSCDFASDANFSGLKTFDWLQEEQPSIGDSRIDNAVTNSQIRSAVDQVLTLKGFVKSNSGQPDFFVSYQAVIEEKTDVTTINRPASFGGTGGYSPSAYFAYSNSETFVTEYDEGSLCIDIVDSKTKKLIWRGVGTTTVLEKANPQKREARIREGVKKILSQFPPII